MQYIALKELKKNPNNPRIIKDEGFKKLKASLKGKRGKDHFEARPCIVSTRTGENIIIAGNTRYQAAKDLGWEEVPTVILEDLTEAQEQEIIIRDNVSNGEWDYLKLKDEFDIDSLNAWGVDIALWEKEEKNKLDEKYSQKIGQVIYEPKETNHQVSDFFERENKFDEDIEKIENEELKEMLYARASFFSTFNFAKIADYYAYQATDEEKKVFEKLALVLLDKDQLIENGFYDLIDNIEESDYE
jgi:hypothetical protein